MLADKDRLDEADIAWMRGLPGFWSLSLGEAAGDSCSAPAWPHCNTHQHASCLGVLISEYGVLVVNKQKIMPTGTCSYQDIHTYRNVWGA